ncbi:hypothetical protein AgCh_038945 [Apium graveolens]
MMNRMLDDLIAIYKVLSKQLYDDPMTMLIAGHETTATVLTCTFYLLSKVWIGLQSKCLIRSRTRFNL